MPPKCLRNNRKGHLKKNEKKNRYTFTDRNITKKCMKKYTFVDISSLIR